MGKAWQFLKSEDFLAGLMFTAIGGLGLYLSFSHSMGTPSRLGAGFFPAMITGGLALVGICIMAKAAVVASPTFGDIAWRPLCFVIGSAILFAFLVDRLGLLIAVVSLIVLSRFSERPINLVETALLSIGMALLSVAVFHYGLRIPFAILPR